MAHQVDFRPAVEVVGLVRGGVKLEALLRNLHVQVVLRVRAWAEGGSNLQLSAMVSNGRSRSPSRSLVSRGPSYCATPGSHRSPDSYATALV
jgi:hypothetical protein